MLRIFFAATGFIFSAVLSYLAYYSHVESNDPTWVAIYLVLALVLIIRSFFNLRQGLRNRNAPPPEGPADPLE